MSHIFRNALQLQKKLKKKGLPADLLALQEAANEEEEGSDFDFEADFVTMEGEEGDEEEGDDEEFEEDLEGFDGENDE